jgi:DNA mismatch repair protein MutS2
MATAARLGIPVEIINYAREILTKGSQEMETLLTNLMAEKQKMESVRRGLTIERDKLARQSAELASEQQRLKDEERKSIWEARDSIVREAAALHKEIRQAAAELRKEKSAASVEQARRAIAAIREQLNSELWQEKAGETQEPDTGTINIGDTVWIKEAGLTATVLAILEEAQEIEVQAGRTRMRLGLDSVEKTTASLHPDTPGITPAVRQPVARAVPYELDLRGKRADEVEPALDTYLNDAVQANREEVRIIHGFGTGTVRSIVRDFLASHPLVKSFRSGERDEGGDGVTVARL